MSDDILDQIDGALERNRRRFDPLGPDWDEGSVEGFFDTMRVRPARAGIEEGSTPAEAASPVPWVQSDTSPLVSFADVAAGPSSGGNPATVDVRRRAQDGNDPVTAALRDELLRQGLTECEIDGVRQVYRDGVWLAAGGVVDDRAHVPLCECRGCATMITDGTQRGLPPQVEALRRETQRRIAEMYGVPLDMLAQPEPVAPLVDAEPHRRARHGPPLDGQHRNGGHAMTEPYTAADVQLVAEAIEAARNANPWDAFTEWAERALSALAEAGRLVPDGAERVAHVLAAGEYSDFSVSSAYVRREDAEAAMHAGAGDDVLDLPLYGPGEIPHRVIVYTAHAVVHAMDARWDSDVRVWERATWSYEATAACEPRDHTDSVGRRNLSADGTDREAVVKSVSDRYAKARAERDGL